MNYQELMTQEQIDRLIEAAEKALTNAYAPYSKFQVGAAVLTKQGNIFTGCNVENVSYGLSICAERNAIAHAVATEGGSIMEVVAIAIANNRQHGSPKGYTFGYGICSLAGSISSRQIPCSPCGACRQVIQEFGQQAIVIFQDRSGWQVTSIEQLLPQGFSF